MTSSRRGDWMVTSTNGQYWPLDPRPEDVCIADIAAGLSKLCRFAGQCNRFYSVAEHSVLVSYEVPDHLALQALMHDATEAYVVDVPRPLKRGLGAAYADIEELNWLAIADAFGLPHQLHPFVKCADDAVLLAEREQLFTPGGPRWSLPGTAANCQIVGYSPMLAQKMFIERWVDLTRGVW